MDKDEAMGTFLILAFIGFLIAIGFAVGVAWSFAVFFAAIIYIIIK